MSGYDTINGITLASLTISFCIILILCLDSFRARQSTGTKKARAQPYTNKDTIEGITHVASQSVMIMHSTDTVH